MSAARKPSKEMIENWVRGTWNTNIRIKVFLLLNLALTPLLLAPTAHEVIFWIILLTIRPNFDLNINFLLGSGRFEKRNQ